MYSTQKAIRILSSTFSDLPDLSQAKIRGLNGLRKISPYLHPDLSTEQKVRLGTLVPLLNDHNRNKERLNCFYDAVQMGYCLDSALQRTTKDRKPIPVVDFRSLSKDQELIVIGDVHAKTNNLRQILLDRENWRRVVEKKAALLFLGDLPHAEHRNLFDMRNSLAVLNWYMQLKILAPLGVYSLLGNHDVLSEDCSKGGVPQSRIFRDVLKYFYTVSEGDPSARDLVFSGQFTMEAGRCLSLLSTSFVRASALAAIAKDCLFFHAAPPFASPRSLKVLDSMRISDYPAESLLSLKQKQFDAQVRATWARFNPNAPIDDPNYYGPKIISRWRRLAGSISRPGRIVLGHSPQYTEKKVRDWERSHWVIGDGDHRHHILVSCHRYPTYAVLRNGKLEVIEIK